VLFRERIALIRAGAGCVVGTAVVSDCLGPMTARQLAREAGKHRVEARSLRVFASKYHDTFYAWVLTAARELAALRGRSRLTRNLSRQTALNVVETSRLCWRRRHKFNALT
jgi:hypothetical protein